MTGTSNERILSEYLVKYAIVKTSERPRPTDLLETLYMVERYQAGDDLKPLRASYDPGIWAGISAAEIDRRLVALDAYMQIVARDRARIWGLN